MLKRLLALTFTTLFAINAAHAETPGEGDLALFLSEPFSSSSLVDAAMGGGGGPTYNLGMFLSDDLMAYGSLRIVNNDIGTNFGLGGGVRFYQNTTGPIRTFFDGNLRFYSMDLDEGSASAFSLGGFFGGEFNLAPRASLAVRVGAAYSDFDGDMSTLDLGVADVLLNIYF